MRPDELLERRHLAELGVVLAEQQQVRRVGHLVRALEAHDRMRAEQGRRILAIDPVLVEEARAVGAEDDGATRLRADEEHRDAGMGRDGRDETRMQLLELLDRETVVVPGEPDQPEVPGADDGDRRRVGEGQFLLVLFGVLVEVDDAIGRLARQRCPGDGRTDALALRDLGQQRVDEGRPLALRLRFDECRPSAHEAANELAKADAIALEEGLAKALAVVGQDHELVRARCLLGRLHERRDRVVDAIQRLERLDAFRPAVVGQLVVVGEVGVDDVRAAVHLLDDQRDIDVAKQHVAGCAHACVLQARGASAGGSPRAWSVAPGTAP